MKKFFLGVLVTISLSSVLNYYWMINGKYERFAFYFVHNIIEGDYLINPLTGRCSVEKFLLPNGQVGSAAEWFGCDNFQKMINIE